MLKDLNSFCSFSLEYPKQSKLISRRHLLAEQVHYKPIFIENGFSQSPNLIVQELLLCHLDSLREILHDFYFMQSAFLVSIYELTFMGLILNFYCMRIPYYFYSLVSQISQNCCLIVFIFYRVAQKYVFKTFLKNQ